MLIQTLAVNSALGVKTIDELVAYSKAKPKTLSYQSASPAPALYMEQLREQKGADWVRVPFKGGAESGQRHAHRGDADLAARRGQHHRSHPGFGTVTAAGSC